METLKLVKEPASIPLTDTKLSYKKQNDIIKKSMFLYSAFGGVKLQNIEKENTEKPIIKKGSIILFCYSLYEADSDIELIDDSEINGNRYIVLELSTDGLKLNAKITNVLAGEYNNELGGIYSIDEKSGQIKKYINFQMYFENGKYINKYASENLRSDYTRT